MMSGGAALRSATCQSKHCVCCIHNLTQNLVFGLDLRLKYFITQTQHKHTHQCVTSWKDWGVITVSAALTSLFLLLSDHHHRNGDVPCPVHIQRVWQVWPDRRHGRLLLPQPNGEKNVPFSRWVWTVVLICVNTLRGCESCMFFK